jgi:hypothetical protein
MNHANSITKTRPLEPRILRLVVDYDSSERAPGWAAHELQVGEEMWLDDDIDLLDPGPLSDPPPAVEESGEIPRDLVHRIEAAIAADADDAVDFIYAEVDQHLRDGAFADVQDLLRALDLAKLDVVHMLAIASITRAAREQLDDARTDYLGRLRRRLAEVDPDRVEELLSGLE